MSQILPCQKTVVGGEPTEDNLEPPDSLQLEHVYGFTAGISRQAVMYSPDGGLLFFGRCSGGFNNESEIAFAKVYVRRFHRRPALLRERKTTRYSQRFFVKICMICLLNSWAITFTFPYIIKYYQMLYLLSPTPGDFILYTVPGPRSTTPFVE